MIKVKMMNNSEKLNENIQKIKEFSYYTGDRGSNYPEKIFSNIIIERAINLVKSLEYQPDLGAKQSLEGIQFRYNKDYGSYFRFFVSERISLHSYIKLPDTKKEIFLVYREDEINQKVKEFMEMNVGEKALKNNLEKLNRFSKFKANWNGYGANPFSPQVIEKAKKLLESLEYQPKVFPVPNGNIQFEYEKDNGSYAEFEISDNNDMIFGYKDNKTNKDIGGEIFTIFTNELNDYVKDFMEKY